MDFYYKRSYRGKVKAVILDWAGTTLDYGCFAPAVVFVEVFRRKNIPITIKQARAPMGLMKKDHIRAITKMEEVEQQWHTAYQRFPTEADVDEMFKEFVPLQLACLADYADLIPGTLEAVGRMRSQGIKVGSTTGYTNPMMDILVEQAAKRGYKPDATVCATDVQSGRPAPFMCFQNLINLQVYPPEAVIKVDDTIPGIEEGLNAGMWTIGLAKTGNEIGLKEEEINQLDPEEYRSRIKRVYDRMAQAGAHYVVDGIWDVLPMIGEINLRLSRGEKP
jgi:phosphonoacetaldehyde hydrolase